MNLKPIPHQNGIIGIGVYWFEWALDIIPIAFAAYCIYLCTLLSLQYWTKANGVDALVSAAFAIIFAAGSATINMLHQFSCIESLQKMMKNLFYIITVCALITHAVLLSFFTPITFARSSQNFYQYTLSNNRTDSTANHYFNLYRDQPYEVHSIIWNRTVSQKIPLASFFIIWGVCFSLYFLGTNYTESQKRLGSTYHPSSQMQPNDQSDLQPLHHVSENENDEITNRNEEEAEEQ